MDVSTLKRDAERVINTLVEVGDTLVTRTGCKIYIPVHYEEANLITIGSETNILGIYAIVVEDSYYAVNSVIANMRIEPTSISKVSVDETEYYEFYFEPGSIVVADTKLVVNDVVAYYVYDEFIAKGRKPWYINYIDLGKIFSTSEHHAGLRVGANRAVAEMIVAAISRNPDELTEYYRQSIQAADEINTRPPAVIPFNSVIYGATNTTARIIGSYFDLGVSSALINPSTRKERIEDILRR